MRTNLKRVALAIAALTAASTGLVLSSTTANAAGTLAGPATLSPLSGTIATNYNLTPPAGATCNGDSANDGYSVRTFMTSEDPTAVTWPGPATATGFTLPLFTAGGGSPFIANTAPNTGQILTIPSLTFSVLGAGTVPNGVYTLGIACVVANQTDTFFTTQVTFTNDSWVFGIPELAPDAPVITGVTGTTVNFTQADANPDVTGFTATVTPTNPAGAALAPIAVPAGATSFVIPPASLVVGTTYSVTLVATNSVGNSDLSNAASFRYDESFPISVTALDVFDGDDVIVDWTAPGGPAPASYDVVITDDASAVVATQTGVAGLSATFAGIPQGTDYTATVTGNYATPGASSTGQATFSVNPNALIVQEITVTRPPGALILTQRCGVFGPLPAYTADAAFPGFPFDLPAGGPTADQVGTSPDIDLAAPGVQPDPEFPNYPFPIPATYPTECGLNMGTASFVNSGPFAGQFYAASGRLNEVTVVDTRDNDAGWTVRGDIEDLFTGSTGDTFDGDFLGWVPSVTSDSDPSGSFTYDQLVTAGPAVKSGTTGGLTGNPVLASAPAGSGLGIAELDARMTLLIPLDADAADYSGTLTLTVA